MKKATVGLIGVLLVIMFNSNAWAQSGLRIDLGGNGFGFSVSDGHTTISTFSYVNYRPYPSNYSKHYLGRPYWHGNKGNKHRHHSNKHWSYHKSSHQPKKGHFGNRRSHNHGDNKLWGHHKPSHQQKNHHNGHQRSYKRDGHSQH